MRLFRAALLTALTAGLTLLGGPAAQAAPATYVALGDSYSSGLGTGTYDDDGADCSRSPRAYPVLVAQQLGTPLTFAACAGARVSEVAGQLGHLNDATTLVTVSVGGNDAGFVEVIAQCTLPWWDCTGPIRQAETYIRDTLPGLLDDLYTRIRDAAPAASVAVVGYPRLFNGTNCGLLAQISPDEQTALNAVSDLLAATLADRADAHGLTFVDPRDAFTGHAVCDDPEWINGLTVPVSESYHPNVAGHAEGYAPLVAAALERTVPAPL